MPSNKSDNEIDTNVRNSGYPEHNTTQFGIKTQHLKKSVPFHPPDWF